MYKYIYIYSKCIYIFFFWFTYPSIALEAPKPCPALPHRSTRRCPGTGERNRGVDRGINYPFSSRVEYIYIYICDYLIIHIPFYIYPYICVYIIIYTYIYIHMSMYICI